MNICSINPMFLLIVFEHNKSSLFVELTDENGIPLTATYETDYRYTGGIDF